MEDIPYTLLRWVTTQLQAMKELLQTYVYAIERTYKKI